MAAVLALGAFLKNAACLRRGSGRVNWSSLHADLSTPEACAALEASATQLLALVGGHVDVVAHDLHPDFFSTRLALALADRLGVPAVGVQHHRAHIGVVMAEEELHEPVIGLALDGVGHGSDGSAWGGEVLLLDGPWWRRVGHLQPLSLPGGDVAAREPWRVAASALHGMGRGGEIATRFGSQVGAPLAQGVAQMLARGFNCPGTTSAGRWFDAAAAALGLSHRQSHEAEAAMALERMAADWLANNRLPVYQDLVHVQGGVIHLQPLMARLLVLGEQRKAHEGAALFHAVLAESLAQAANVAAAEAGVMTVVLAGGCFFNRVLTERVTTRLKRMALTVLKPATVDCGDSGLALGQAWVAQQELPLLASSRMPLHAAEEQAVEQRACA
jgi:hydrogenase maturation protein HypF